MTDSSRSFLFLTASARRHGNSQALARQAASTVTAPCIWVDLAAMDLPVFHDLRPMPPPAPTGDLAQGVAQMQRATDIVIVAPVYWYALPAPAKLFLDHWSGLLDLPEQKFVAQMAAKTMWLITARADPDPGVAAPVEDAVRRTAHWLGMAWGGALHGVGDAPGDVTSCPAWALAPGFLCT